MEDKQLVLVGVTDVFFYTKIRDAFRPAGYALKRVKSYDDVRGQAQTGAKCGTADIVVSPKKSVEQAAALFPIALVLDMNDPGFDATGVLKAVKGEAAPPTIRAIPVLAFANHEEVDTWRQAKELGIDKIVSRNEFSSKTLALLEDVLRNRRVT